MKSFRKSQGSSERRILPKIIPIYQMIKRPTISTVYPKARPTFIVENENPLQNKAFSCHPATPFQLVNRIRAFNLTEIISFD